MINPHKSLKIAICGIRGIPACYGGFETFAEELSRRLVQRGHKVRVYGRSHVIKHRGSQYLGVDITLLPAPKHKFLETPVHSLLCLIHLLFHRVDALLVCNAANSPFCFLPRLAKTPLAINVDGIERLRAKWNIVGRTWYRLGEYCSVLFADRIIADAQVIAEYYKERFKAESTVITYGHRQGDENAVQRKLRNETSQDEKPEILTELGVEQSGYVLYVSRLEPENNAHRVVEAYNSLPDDLKMYPLVLVGDAPYAQEYIASLKLSAGPGVIFAGYRFGQSYENLQLNALVYVQATDVGGTHPALVESMGFGNAVIANGTPENREVLGDAGFFYEKNDSARLGAQLEKLLRSPDLIAELRHKAYRRAKECYSWEKVTDDYEALFRELAAK